MRAIYSIICIIFLFASCTENRYFEKNHDFTERSWGIQDSVQFEFDIDSTDVPYQIKLNIRNTMDYPFRNLYIKHTLLDSNKTIADKLHNIQLFDPKTGKPFGDRQSEIYSHQLIIQDSVYFPAARKYTVQLKQYMREKELNGLVSTGIRIEKME